MFNFYKKHLIFKRETVLRSLKRPEVLFVLFASFFGLTLVFLVPPMQAPDEQTHFFQSYAVSNLDFKPHRFQNEKYTYYGSELPKSVFVATDDFLTDTAGKPDVEFDTRLFGEYINQPLNPQVTAHEHNGSGYAPIVYLPQAIGITIGKIFNTSPLIMIWLGRLINLIVWVVLIYLAIKIIPFGKWAMAILALNPMAVFLSASLSADVVTTALAFLFFSIIASSLVSKSTLSTKTTITLVGLLVLLGLTKPTNILFGLLLLAIPWKSFVTLRKFWLICLGSIGIAIAVSLAWNVVVVGEASQSTAQLQRPGVGIDSAAQLTGIVQQPLYFIKTLLVNYVFVTPGHYGNQVLQSTFGRFGWLDTSLPLWTIALYILGLFLALIYQLGRGKRLSLFQKAVSLTILFGLCLANVLAMYLVYTPAGNSVIDGVQGRYFIAGSVLLLGLFTARSKYLEFSEKRMAIILSSIMFIVLTMTIVSIYMRYY